MLVLIWMGSNIFYLQLFSLFQRCFGHRCLCCLLYLLSSNQPNNADPHTQNEGVISKVMWFRPKMWKTLACATLSAPRITAARASISTLIIHFVSWMMLMGSHTLGIMCWERTTPTLVAQARFVSDPRCFFLTAQYFYFCFVEGHYANYRVTG